MSRRLHLPNIASRQIAQAVINPLQHTAPSTKNNCSTRGAGPRLRGGAARYYSGLIERRHLNSYILLGRQDSLRKRDGISIERRQAKF